MNRWNIRTIAIYSHDGQRRDLNLRPGQVNIITGPSHSGKSAIAEVMDYCMGASTCHLPGVVRDSTSWVALLWERGESQLTVARQVPRGSAASHNWMYWRKGTVLDEMLPDTSAGLFNVGSRDAVMREIESAFGIGEVRGETLNDDREGHRISVRQVLPFILQDDDVIVSKNTLLRGAQDDRRRNLIDALPYFLRVSDEQTASLEAEYRRLLKAKAVDERRALQTKRLAADEHDRAFDLLYEVAQVGLTDPPGNGMTLDQAISTLTAASQWRPGERVDTGTSQLGALYSEESRLRGQIQDTRRQIDRSDDALRTASDFMSTASEQSRRLSSIGLFKDQTDHCLCPVCGNDVVDALPKITALVAAQKALDAELSSIERERPKLDQFAIAKKDDLARDMARLRTVREQIRGLVGDADAEQERLSLDNRRARVLGRVSLYLESVAREHAPTAAAPPNAEARIKELESVLDVESRRERLSVEQQTVSAIATKVLAELPFEDEYRDCNVYFLARTLQCGISTSSRQIDMRDVGSDENYLSLHVALLVAFHRFFKRRKSPVPGILLFDQISRPYYPAEKTPDGVVVSNDSDALALRQYFGFLFDEIEREGDLQIVVLEHAYIASDPRFVSATIERWENGGTKLIPDHWPRLQ